jgi:hypothetical protein
MEVVLRESLEDELAEMRESIFRGVRQQSQYARIVRALATP